MAFWKSQRSEMGSTIVLTILAMVSGIERDLVGSRTQEAPRSRKAAGIKPGRPKGPGKSKQDPFREEIAALLKKGSKQSYVAKPYGSTPDEPEKHVKKYKMDYALFIPVAWVATLMPHHNLLDT